MPYQGLIFAAVLGVGLALAIGLLIANNEQWQQPQTHYQRPQEPRRRGGGGTNRRRESYNQDICPICHDMMPSFGRVLKTLSCNHKYHEDCIRRWFQVATVCPVCREHASL